MGGKIWMKNSITFHVFFIETFPKFINVCYVYESWVVAPLFVTIYCNANTIIFLPNMEIDQLTRGLWDDRELFNASGKFLMLTG